MQINPAKIPDCYELFPAVFQDERGSFVKTYQEEIFKRYQLETYFLEEYYSVSYQNVLRGLHFQLPPQEHTKMVYCVQGQVMDVIVDLRVGSPTYGQFETFELSEEKANIIYIPPGLAHGFQVISKTAIMMYKVSTAYSPDKDTGILWDSINISWHCPDPILSERDRRFLPFSEFDSPFVYED